MQNTAHDRGHRPGRHRALVEFAIVAAASAAVAIWLIPAQTSQEMSFGLPPDLLPTLCAAAIGLLALLGLIVTALGGSRQRNDDAEPGYNPSTPCFPAISVMVILAASVALLPTIGSGATALILAPALMLRLGERKPLRIIPITLIVAGAITWLLG